MHVNTPPPFLSFFLFFSLFHHLSLFLSLSLSPRFKVEANYRLGPVGFLAHPVSD